jgi:hypothetical protein
MNELETDSTHIRTGAREKFDLSQLVLFWSGYFEERGIKTARKNDMCLVLNLSQVTLNTTLKKLRNASLLTEDWYGMMFKHILTLRGWEAYRLLKEEVMGMSFTPDLHGCEGKVGDLLGILNNPAHIMIVTHSVMINFQFDVLSLYEYEKLLRGNSVERNVLKQLSDREGLLNEPFEVMM